MFFFRDKVIVDHIVKFFLSIRDHIVNAINIISVSYNEYVVIMKLIVYHKTLYLKIEDTTYEL